MFKSRLYIAVRVVLALGICLLAWLCVQQAVEMEQLKRDLIQALQDSPKSHLPGFLWQHLVVLSVFAVSIAVAALLYLFVSKTQRNAVAVAVVALVVLLVQLLVVAPAVVLPAVQLKEQLQNS
jgi:hypothetical protein